MKRAQIFVTTCDRRAFEVEQTKQFLRLNGYLVSDYHKKVDTQAELIVLFTCGFTQVAEELGFDLLKKIENAKRTGSKVVFGGCIPAINPKRTSKEFQGPTFTPRSYSNLDEIIGAQHRFEEVRMPNVCCRSARSNTRTTLNGVLAALRQFDYSFSGLKNFQKWLRFVRLLATLKSAYSIQIEKGCSMECTYCAIRKAVGPLRSKIPEGVIDELQIGLDTGHKVFTLYGDNAGSYGLDKGTNLGPLLDQVAQVNGQFQLHLTDISPVYLPLMYTQAIALCRRGVLVSMYNLAAAGSLT